MFAVIYNTPDLPCMVYRISGRTVDRGDAVVTTPAGCIIFGTVHLSPCVPASRFNPPALLLCILNGLLDVLFLVALAHHFPSLRPGCQSTTKLSLVISWAPAGCAGLAPGRFLQVRAQGGFCDDDSLLLAQHVEKYEAAIFTFGHVVDGFQPGKGAFGDLYFVAAFEHGFGFLLAGKRLFQRFDAVHDHCRNRRRHAAKANKAVNAASAAQGVEVE